MKNGLKAIGKAVVYFLVYFLTQVITSFVYTVILSTKMTMELMEAGEEVETLALSEAVTAELMGRLTEITVVSGILALVIYFVAFLIRKKNFIKEVAISKIPVNSILPIVVLAASFNVITSVAISYFPWPQAWIDSYAANSSAIDGTVMSWIAAVLMAPVLEEIVFRGLMYTRLKKGLPTIVAALLTSIVFGLVHGTIIWAIYTFIFSMILIWVFERFQSLTACIVLHLFYNLTGMALSLIPESVGFIVWILFAASIAGMFFAVKSIGREHINE